MTDTHRESGLEARARRGDRTAAGELARLSRERLVRFAYRYLGDVHEAEDVAQDSLLALLAADPWPSGSVLAWLFQAVRYRCLDRRKRRGSARIGRGTLFGDSEPSPRTGPRTAAAREDEREALRRYLAELPESQAEVLVMRYFESMKRREIAEVLETTESCVKSRLFEGSRELRRRISRDDSSVPDSDTL